MLSTVPIQTSTVSYLNLSKKIQSDILGTPVFEYPKGKKYPSCYIMLGVLKKKQALTECEAF